MVHAEILEGSGIYKHPIGNPPKEPEHLAPDVLGAAALDDFLKERSVQAPRQQHKGWLLKRKNEDSRSRLFSGTNRRFFTLDFQSQQFYYSSGDSSKTVSTPTPFRDIFVVQPVRRSLAEAAEEAGPASPIKAKDEDVPQLKRSDSKGSLTSGMRIPRIPSFGTLAKRPAEQQFGLTVRLATKVMELCCSSKEDADQWLAAFREAIAMGAVGPPPSCGSPSVEIDEVCKAETSTAPGSSCESHMDNWSAASPSVQGSTPREEPTCSAPKAPLPLPLPEPLPERQTKDPPRQRRAFGLLPARSPKKEALSKVASPAIDKPANVSVPAPFVSVDEADGDAWLPIDGHLQRVCADRGDSPKAHSSPQIEAARYADQGKGMTMQQRLAAMEFSDDEDEDEEPVRAAKPKGTAAQPSTLEPCHSFQMPESDGE